MAAYAFLADFAAYLASFLAWTEALLAYLASLTERAAFLADTDADFLRLLALEADYYALLTAAFAAFLAALT